MALVVLATENKPNTIEGIEERIWETNLIRLINFLFFISTWCGESLFKNLLEALLLLCKIQAGGVIIYADYLIFLADQRIGHGLRIVFADGQIGTVGLCRGELALNQVPIPENVMVDILSAAETAAGERDAAGAGSGGEAQRTDVYSRFCCGGAGCAFWLVYPAECCVGWSGCGVFICLCPLCGGAPGEYIPESNDPGAGKPESDRHRPVWNCPSSYVHGNCHHVSINAIGPQFSDIIHHHVRIYSRDCQENQE